MQTIYRQIRPSRLTETQRQLKLQKDSGYEIAVQNLSVPFYTKKRTGGVTAEEEATYNQTKTQLWDDYKSWAISFGLYEEVTPEQYLAEKEGSLNEMLVEVNEIRVELDKAPLELKTKVMQV